MALTQPETVLHGGDLDAARQQFPKAPEPWIDLSTGINPQAYPLPELSPEAWSRLPQKSDERAQRDDPSYKAGVELWHQERMELLKTFLKDEVREGECAAFLNWGEPTLYDSMLRILQNVRDDDSPEFDYEIIPGISSNQALAARHKVALNTIGESIHITTGRKLAEGLPDFDSIVVMLDSGEGLKATESEDVDIYWGAYLGTEYEILGAGKMSEVAGDIQRIRRQAKAERGWIMDTYLLRRNS